MFVLSKEVSVCVKKIKNLNKKKKRKEEPSGTTLVS